jgi:hypothetical protein
MIKYTEVTLRACDKFLGCIFCRSKFIVVRAMDRRGEKEESLTENFSIFKIRSVV